jgi:3-phenylpropionate/trans-cinnamate dioxygenase ferredoxin subunit
MELKDWIETCLVDDIEEEDLIRFDFEDRSFAIYRTEDEEVYATDGFCTHEKVHLENGLVMGTTIECPKHNGRFDFTTGEPKRAPVCKALKTYPVKVKEGKIFIKID